MSRPIQVVTKAILFDQERVLLLQRAKKDRRAHNPMGWDFPGGSVEDSEPVLKALTREVEEETGLKIKVVGPAYIYDEMEENKHLVIIKFSCIEPSGEIKLSSEHQSYEWLQMTDLEVSTIPEWMKDEIRRAYRVSMVYLDH